MYTKNLPNNHDILTLGLRIADFPSTRSEIVRIARKWNTPEEVIEFMRLFPSDQLFNSRTDLVARYESLAGVIRQQWETPHENTPLLMS